MSRVLSFCFQVKSFYPYQQTYINQRIRMHLACEESADFSKYFADRPHTEDKSLYNYSHTNETLLLETTEIARPQPRHASILEDLYEQLEVTLSQSQIGMGAEPDLQDMCKQLLGALQKLESKVDRMEEQEKGRQQKQSRADSRVQSVATLSIKGSKCRCEDRAIGSLLDFVQQRSKMDVYRQEKEALQRHVVRLEVTNEDLRKQLRKLQRENFEVKELLRQTQKQISRKQVREEYNDHGPFRPGNNHCCTLQDIPECDFRPSRRNEKENIKQLYQRKMRDEELRGYPSQAPMTPNPLLRTAKSHPLQTTNTKMASPTQAQRLTQISQRVERLLDIETLKTESKPREGKGMTLKAFSRAIPRNYRPQLLEQDEYQVEKGKPLLQHFETMTSLPDSPSFFDLKRVHSSHSLLSSQNRLSPLRSLPKALRR